MISSVMDVENPQFKDCGFFFCLIREEAMTALKVEGLNKVFRTKVSSEKKGLFKREIKEISAVKNLDLHVAKGEILAFLGPNGAGKSTTIKLITGILSPDSGSIDVLGLNPHKDRRKLAHQIGTVFGQKSQLWYHLPARDSFELLGAIYGMDRSSLNSRINFLTEVFEISEFLGQPVRKLSLGQRIRCEIAASMLHSPPLLFLDEPTIGLDVVVKQKIRQLIRRINEEEKVTVFLTSHDAGDVEKICRRAMVINRGELLWDGTVKEMKYSLLNKRVLDIKTDAAGEWELPGCTLLKQTEYSVKLEADLNETNLDSLIPRILQKGTIQDIAINPPPMEEIITLIYQGGIA